VRNSIISNNPLTSYSVPLINGATKVFKLLMAPELDIDSPSVQAFISGLKENEVGITFIYFEILILETG
jgi:hypothetical protein